MLDSTIIDPQAVFGSKEYRVLLRYAAKESLRSFAEYVFPGYECPPHILRSIEALEQVERGEIKRLLITTAPRHGKSQLVSQIYPAWILGRHPDWRVASVTYGESLSTTFGRRIRNTLQSPEFTDVFPDVRMDERAKAAHSFLIDGKKGEFWAAAVGSGITGRGFELILCDDLTKGREEADSELMRDRLYDYYTNDLYSRLEPGGSIVLVGTIWHEDDIIGRLLSKPHHGWTHLAFPAINENDEALWPSRFPIDVLHDIRDTIGPRAFSALYQGRPQPDEGTVFTREMFEFYDVKELQEHIYKHPRSVVFFMSSDAAITFGKGDYTVIATWAMDEHERIYLVDLWRQQTTPDVWVERIVESVRHYSPFLFAYESGVIENSAGPWLEKRLREEHIDVWRKPFSSTTNKVARAMSVQAMMRRKKLFVPRGKPFTDDFISECLSFPTGRYDDQVDVLSLFGRTIDYLYGGQAMKAPVNPYDEIFNNALRPRQRGL